MRFEHRAVLWLLVLLPLLALWFVRSDIWRRRALETLAFALPLARFARVAFWEAIFALLCLAFLLLAGADPRPDHFEESSRSNRDILVVVDTSLSMAAEDVRPSRLAYERETVRALLKRLNGERVGIVGFAGRGVLQCPLTRDYAAAAMLIDSLTTDILPQPGSALGDGLAKALGAFSGGETRTRLLLVLTDGEDHDSNPLRLVSRLRRTGARLFVLGIGTEEGSPIPIRESGALSYKTDRDGQIVISRMNAALLRQLAEEAGGTFYRASPDGHVIEPLLDAMTRVALAKSSRRLRYGQLLVAIAALACLVASVIARAWLRYDDDPRQAAKKPYGIAPQGFDS